MKTKKRVMVIGAILLGVVLAGSAVVEAWGPGTWWGRGGGFPGSFRPGFGGRRNIQDFVLFRMDEMANNLNLTAAQRGKYDELRAGVKARLSEAADNRLALRKTLRAEMAKEPPDVEALVEKIKANIRETSAARQRNLDLFTAFYASLDNNQKKQLLREIRERTA